MPFSPSLISSTRSLPSRSVNVFDKSLTSFLAVNIISPAFAVFALYKSLFSLMVRPSALKNIILKRPFILLISGDDIQPSPLPYLEPGTPRLSNHSVVRHAAFSVSLSIVISMENASVSYLIKYCNVLNSFIAPSIVTLSVTFSPVLTDVLSLVSVKV